MNAPSTLRDQHRELPQAKLLVILANSRPDRMRESDQADITYALRALAQRHRDLAEEITHLEQRMMARATTANPSLMAIKGIGVVVGAQLLITASGNPDRLRTSSSFAALCGTSPIPVSSGRTDRHRLSRGGDRQTNAALHHIVKVRLSYDPRTRSYRDAHLSGPKSVARADCVPETLRGTILLAQGAGHRSGDCHPGAVGPSRCAAKGRPLIIGYARCSTDSQDLTAQQQHLTALDANPGRIYVDQGFTGSNRDRPGCVKRSPRSALVTLCWSRSWTG